MSKIDLTKYPNMVAMLARRDQSRKPLTDIKPMHEIPEEWSFDANGIRKNAQKNIASPVNDDPSLPF